MNYELEMNIRPNMKQKKILFLLVLPFIIISAAALIFFIKEENHSSSAESSVNFQNNFSNKNINDLSKDTLTQINYLELHNSAILVDTHNDFVWKVFDKGAEFGTNNSFTQSDLPRLKSGGVDVQVFAVWIPMKSVSRSYNFVIKQIERLRQIEDSNSLELEFAENYDEIIRVTNGKKICGLIGVEGGTAIENNLDNINSMFDLGVRYIGLTWNNSNSISTSAKDAVERGKSGGLTEFGTEVVKRMNEVGMLVDVSHLSEEGFWDVIEVSTSPIIASHSNCYSINPHYRNLTDEQIKAIALDGGYIGVNFHNDFLDKNGKTEGTSIDKVVEHIDHIKNLVGADYIGIGADFDGGITPAKELYDASCYPELTKKLVEKGYTKSEIKKILGENFLRVFKQVCG